MNSDAHQKLAQILVDHSTHVKPGDKVAIETTTNAENLVRRIYELVLERGGQPHLILNLPEQGKIFFRYANDDQLAFTPSFQELVTEKFEVYIRIRAEIDPLGLRDVPAQKQSARQKGDGLSAEYNDTEGC